MPREFHRSKRVAERIHRLLSELIRTQVRDPRVGFVTVTDVVVSRDLAVAKVFVSVLDESGGIDEALEGLTHAGGFLRRELAREIKLRVVPELRFQADKSVADGQRLSALIDAARADDTRKSGDDS